MENTRLKIITERDQDDDQLHVGKIKLMTGNDSIIRKPHNLSFKQSFKLLFQTNDAYENVSDKNFNPKSPNTYEVINKLYGFDNPLFANEYAWVIELFDLEENILDFGDSEFSAIWVEDSKCFYLLEVKTKRIYRCDLDDIRNIYYSYNSMVVPISTITIKSIEITKTGHKYTYGKKKFNLDINLFKIFIRSGFDIYETAKALKN